MKLRLLLAGILGVSVAVLAEEPKPVPLLSPEEEVATFKLPAGLKVEVVASEPVVQHPVAIAFDARGRLFVAEMRGYMPTTSGKGEDKPVGRVTVLEDTKGEGHFDKSTVFLDKLVLPRAVGFVDGQVLIGTPPRLLLCNDSKNDQKAEELKTLQEDWGMVSNPENSANGLLYGLDNWIYSADYTKRLRWNDGKVQFSDIPVLGQFGLTRDDWGRWFFNTNSDYLRGSLVPPHYQSRNPRSPMGIVNAQIGHDQNCYPAHPTTVNRGYREGFLVNGRLKEFTAACSPCIYRGEILPSEYYGNAFVCEPSANFIRRAVLSGNDMHLLAKNAYKNAEFLTSTYERFRPVNMITGPDGALYIVDMHHGLLQHRMSITDYAKENYTAKQLDKHLLTGRIFRVVPEGFVHKPIEKLDGESAAQLVAHLKDVNGWSRDTAQRLIVEKKMLDAEPALREIAQKDSSPVHRAEALWTLDGIGKLTSEDIHHALSDADAHVRENGIRLAEPNLKELLPDVMKLIDDPDQAVHVQLALSVSAFSDDATATLLRKFGNDSNVREAVVSGVAGREIALMKMIASDAPPAVLTDLTRSIVNRDDNDGMAKVFDIAANDVKTPARQLAILSALPTARKDEFDFVQLINLPSKPESLTALQNAHDEKVRSRAEKVAAVFNWPGKPQPPKPPVPPLNDDQQQLFNIGKLTFATTCAQCHQPDGRGLEGKAPPLVGSPWVQGPPGRIVRIVLHGMHGPINVRGHAFNMDMPSFAMFSDDQIAGVLTFIRRSWGHEASPVDPDMVTSIRDWTQAHQHEGWTQQELLKVK